MLAYDFHDPELAKMAQVAAELDAEMGTGARYSLPVTPNIVSNPAAGSDFLYTIPAAPGGYQFLQTQEVVAVRAGLATSSTVANRQPALYLADASGHVIALVPYAAAQVASTTYFYTWAVNQPIVAQTINQVLNPLPPGIILAQNMKIVSLTNGIQAGDQWSSIVVTLKQVA